MNLHTVLVFNSGARSQILGAVLAAHDGQFLCVIVSFEALL